MKLTPTITPFTSSTERKPNRRRIGGAVVFTHGMRVLNLVDEPTTRASSPVPSPEKEEAEA